MHNNYYFLRRLSPALGKLLNKSVVTECFTQSKDELIIRFDSKNAAFFIKASLLPAFSCLSFPAKSERAKKNSVDLFPDLIGRGVIGHVVFENERSFGLRLSEDFVLVFKMHGNRSNVVLFKDTVVHDLFKKDIPADAALQLHELDRRIDFSYEAFVQHQQNLPALYFTFGKIVWRYLDENGFASKTLQEKWNDLQSVLLLLDQADFNIVEDSGGIVLSLLPFGHVFASYSDPVEALNYFFIKFNTRINFEREKARCIQALEGRIRSGKNYILKNEEKVRSIVEDQTYRKWADLIMANLDSQAVEGILTVTDFYTGTPVEIKLKKDKNLQRNAEIFYRKAKNQQTEIDRLQEAVASKRVDLARWETALDQVINSKDRKELQGLVKELDLEKNSEKAAPALPFMEFIVNDFKVWLGRNAAANDQLTFHYAYKDDLWFHAKDVAGSHVLLKYKAGKPFPKDVIERAASLAAYNSKRKNEALCPVVVTPKKYVRKRKGDPPGKVVVEMEEVILVPPLPM